MLTCSVVVMRLLPSGAGAELLNTLFAVASAARACEPEHSSGVFERATKFPILLGLGWEHSPCDLRSM